MTTPAVSNAEEESGNPGEGGQAPQSDNTAVQTDPIDVSPTQDATKDEESTATPFKNTDTGQSGV